MNTTSEHISVNPNIPLMPESAYPTPLTLADLWPDYYNARKAWMECDVRSPEYERLWNEAERLLKPISILVYRETQAQSNVCIHGESRLLIDTGHGESVTWDDELGGVVFYETKPSCQVLIEEEVAA